MVKVDVPSAMAAGISRRGMLAARRAPVPSVHNEEGDEKADAAIGDERASQYHGQHGTARAELLGHELYDGGDRPAVLHQLAEQRA